MMAMEFVKLDKGGKIYLPKRVRSKMGADRYVVLTLPDGDIVLHRVKESGDALKDFQSCGTIKKPLSDVKKEILKEALVEAGE